ncbi:MAG: chromosomal replication initiator protein DnaA [Fusobacteriota bacterium]
MKDKSKDVWNRVLKMLQWSTSESDYNSWLLNVIPVLLDSDCLVVEVDNNFIKDRIEKKFKDKIIEILNEVLVLRDGFTDLKIQVKQSNKIEEDDMNMSNKEEKIEEISDEDDDKEKPLNLFNNNKYNLKRRSTFENFVVGKSNEFAEAASEAVARMPGKVYNPLFIHGGVGLGKTHLMHAIGNYILNNDSSKKIFYCSSEQFTNDLIKSLKNDKMQQFRSKYRKLDVLLIDDIQFLAGKDSTQEEFFHTFNELHQLGKQIVISSDRSPKEIKNVGKRLVSRFEWGLIADIQQPDFETRVAILNNKVETENIKLSEEVINYIAESVNSNIRELEGALNRIVARASLLKKRITVELVEEILYDVLKNKSKLVTKEKIINVVSKHYDIPVEQMKSKRRKKRIAKSRQVAMYFLRNMLQLPFAAIGDIFGGKDHTTVMHSVSKIEKEKKEKKFFEKDLAMLRERIES